MSGSQSAPNQFIRKVALVVSSANQSIDLSQFRIKFQVQQSDLQSPNNLWARIYNLKPQTVTTIEKEFTFITLQAGYVNGNQAIIFSGTVTQTRRGRETNVDSFLEIFAADCDYAHYGAFVNATLAPGASSQDQVDAIDGAMRQQDPTYQGKDPSADGVDSLAPTGGIMPRGKVLFGMGSKYLRDLGYTVNSRFSLQNGRLVVVSTTGYRRGTPVEINSTTGLIGIPEATQNGIEVTVLLNPLIQIGQQVRINQGDINKTAVNQQGVLPNWGAVQLFADVTTDGVYRVMVAEHAGDTRGNEYYSHLVVLAIDQSANPSQSVAQS